jgi:hypothetical protein
VGEWCVELPRKGPCAEGSHQQCLLKEHRYRKRKTGPEHDLLVVHCKTHHRFFTVYPPGFGPYGRQRLPVQAADIDTAPVLRAARDAADPATRRWPDWADADGVEPAWASTQWRQLRRWGQWLGLVGPELYGQRIATVLGLELHEHAAARKHYQRGGYRHRGQAILDVLQAVGRVGDVLVRLLRAAHAAGLLGRAFLLERLGRLRPLVPV